jgi:hypothetical protein
MEFIWSPPVCAVFCIVIIAVVLLRLFGFVFFGSTTSKWALVPALVMIAMLCAANFDQKTQRYLAAVLVLCYLCSIYFYGWRILVERIADGGSVGLEGTEAAIIAVFALLYMIRKER